MGMKPANPGSVSAMLCGAQWLTENHFILGNINIFTIPAKGKESKQFSGWDELMVQGTEFVIFVIPYIHRTIQQQ